MFKKFILKSRFSHTLLNTYISCSSKRGERTWQSLTCHIENVWNVFVTHRSDEVQTLIKLCQVTLVLPTKKIRLAVKEVLAHKIELRMLWETDWKLRGWMCRHDHWHWGATFQGLDFSYSTALDVWARTNRRISTFNLSLPVIKKGIEVYKGMPERDSALKCFEV